MFATTDAFSGFSVDDIERARAVHGGTLGLAVEDTEGMLGLKLGGGTVLVHPKGERHAPATFTVLNVPVEDIDAAVDRLTAAGVALERYPDLPDPDA